MHYNDGVIFLVKTACNYTSGMTKMGMLLKRTII